MSKFLVLCGLAVLFPEAAAAIIQGLIVGLALSAALFLIVQVIKAISYAMLASALGDYASGKIVR